MKHQIVAIDLYTPDCFFKEDLDPTVHCVWCVASGQWKKESDRLFIAFLNEEEDLEFIFRRWAQPIIQLAEERDISEENISMINDLIVQIEWIIEDPVHDSEPYLRDQFYGFIQLITSLTIESLAEQRLDRTCRWMDVRDILRATDTYRSGDLEDVKKAIRTLEELLDEDHILFLAWNLATTSMNDSVTLSPNSLEQIQAAFDLSPEALDINR